MVASSKHIPKHEVIEKKPKEESGRPEESQHQVSSSMSGLLMGEWSCPLHSQPQVKRLMGLKPLVGDHRIGFSADDWNPRTVLLFLFFSSSKLLCHDVVRAQDNGGPRPFPNFNFLHTHKHTHTHIPSKVKCCSTL